EAKTVRMTAPHQVGARFGHHGAHTRPHQAAVNALIDFRNAGDGREGEVVLGAVAADLADVVECAALQSEYVAALHQLAVSNSSASKLKTCGAVRALCEQRVGIGRARLASD